jgi:Ca2+-binding RTX toxin-like protein
MSNATIPGAPAGSATQTLYWDGSSWVESPVGSTADSFWGRNTGANNDSYTGSANPTFANGRNGSDTLDGGGGNDVLVGGGSSDRLIGGTGADTLFGGAATVSGTLGSPIFSNLSDSSADTLIGGTGDDTFIIINTGGMIIENADEGTDTVLVGGNALTSYTLVGNVENLALLDPTSATGRAFTGNAGDNSITGGAGADTLIGGDGADVLRGGGGNDRLSDTNGATTMFGEAGADTLTGNLADDSLDGGSENDSITGNGGNDTLLGGTGADTLDGGDGHDSLDGGDGADRLDGGNNNDTILGGAGADTMLGGFGTDSMDGGLGADSLFGGGDADTIVGGGGADTIRGEDGNDVISVSGSGGNVDGGNNDDLIVVGAGTSGYVISGGSGTDTLAFDFDGTVTVSGGSVTGPGGLSVTVSNMELIRLSDGSTVAFGNGSFVVCFAAGTRILTAAGEKPVEALRPGELVATVSGRGAPLQPVVFIGRRRIRLAGHPKARELAPVRVRAGALGAGVPHRDLLVSADHCLFLDGALVPARLLVNGTSVVVEEGLAEVSYVHIELPAHDVVLAEGAAAESWLDAGNRAWFENAPVALLTVTGTLADHATAAAEPCAPVVQAGPRLAAIRDALALRALVTQATGPMPLRRRA